MINGARVRVRVRVKPGLKLGEEAEASNDL
jgi:hypothetical protein